MFYYDSRPGIFRLCLPLAPRLLGYSNFLRDLNSGYVNDLKSCWWLIVLSVIGAVLVSILFLYLASLFLSVILWAQAGLAVVLLMSLGILGIWTAADFNQKKFEWAT